MKRKIAVILAADIAGYSRLIAEDEEETLRRFEGYRTVFAEFVDRGGGRIFNTAGDAILAEFQSAVEAVRCAIDVQESLKARNLAYPASRHMNFRIGITIGDVVERENGDLLGDGVNIAARLEGVAPPGGICVSRSVHEAVASKMALRFADAGPQSLKNIPERIHAYTLALEESQPASVVAESSKTAPAAAPALALAARLPQLLDTLRAHWTTAALAGLALVVAGVYAYEYLPRDTGESETATAEEPAPSTSPASPAATIAATPDETQSKPAPEKRVETAAKSPEPDPNLVRAAPGPLASRYVLTRQWKDCHESDNADLAADACKGLLDTGGLSSDDQATIRYKYARALRDKGDPDAAIASYDRSIELNPTADAYNHRGIAYYDKGDYTRAIADYTEALRLKPSDADALNNRAWTRYKAGELDSALQDANRAIALDGRKAYIWDTRGHINEARGARNAAISDYRKALNLDAGSDSSSEGLARLGAAH
ncbi:tetratricopeptide repeat protein [Hyphomicrobium sp.]|uniref:tetratricopeptide repeat protein n=1 Tax=Hyphomicrobium sp. TaxID=82 RepID=UPI0025C700F4|nr:tetratricopeptide repeat protein [Hyphomicrobium sp.]MCC7251901.1 tetratricopeptide repeat protein [Hyphomicrobium sp.]